MCGVPGGAAPSTPGVRVVLRRRARRSRPVRVAGARGISEENARMANDMLVAYFRALLEARQKNPETAQDSARLSADMKRALEFLLT